MAVSASNIAANHRGIYFEFTGDGATASIALPHQRFVKAGQTAQAFVVTAPSSFQTGTSNRGGFRAPTDGTAVTATAAISGDTLTVTTSPAVTNALKAYVTVIYDKFSD